ncbi:MAG: thioredoxin family protein [Syntrophobacterales bacterium]|jgi:thioredoxin 1|nr:thioredoxin family protein [Syntrophobacterales bacterium]
MKSSRRSILILLLVACICLSLALVALAQTGRPPQALPQLLEFDRKFCPVCKASERVILAVKDAFPGQFVVTKLYIDEAEPLFRRYKVAIVPTQVFLDPNGKEVYRHEGVFKTPDLVDKLRELKFIRD